MCAPGPGRRRSEPTTTGSRRCDRRSTPQTIGRSLKRMVKLTRERCGHSELAGDGDRRPGHRFVQQRQLHVAGRAGVGLDELDVSDHQAGLDIMEEAQPQPDDVGRFAHEAVRRKSHRSFVSRSNVTVASSSACAANGSAGLVPPPLALRAAARSSRPSGTRAPLRQDLRRSSSARWQRPAR